MCTYCISSTSYFFLVFFLALFSVEFHKWFNAIESVYFVFIVPFIFFFKRFCAKIYTLCSHIFEIEKFHHMEKYILKWGASIIKKMEIFHRLRVQDSVMKYGFFFPLLHFSSEKRNVTFHFIYVRSAGSYLMTECYKLQTIWNFKWGRIINIEIQPPPV